MPMELIADLLRDALDRHATAGRVALEGPGGPIGYAALRDRVDQAGAAVQGWLGGRGDPVGIIGPRGLQSISAYLGAMLAGACPCFVEPKLSPEMQVQRMVAVGMRDLMLDRAVAPDTDGLVAAGIRLHPLDGHAQYRLGDTALQPHDRAMMLFTSGSTGQPKGVVLSHANLACNARGVIARTGLTEGDRLLHVMPLFHTNGINNQLIAPFLAGATVILLDRFAAEEMPGMVRHFRPTYMTGVPTIYARMLPHARPHDLASLRFLRCGSAPITVQLHERIEAGFGRPLIVSYGLSEATCTSTMNPPDGRRVGTVGTVLEGQQVKLFAPGAAVEVGPESEGEICIGGPSLMLGYLGSQDASPIRDGWLHTGDLGRFDAAGFLTITGRIKDVIIRGGENLSPQMIESALMRHKTVGQCCVVGQPHAELGEVPVAFVVARSGETCSAEEMRDHVGAVLSRIYVPAEVRIVSALPENSVGKVDRNRLKQMLAPTGRIFSSKDRPSH